MLQQFDEQLTKQRMSWDMKIAREMNAREMSMQEETASALLKAKTQCFIDQEEGLRAQDAKHKDTLEGEKAKLSEHLTGEFKEDADKHLAAVKGHHDEFIAQAEGRLGDVAGKLKLLDAVIEEIQERRKVSGSVHECAAAVVGFANALRRSRPVWPEIDALKETFKGDATVSSIIDTIPPRVAKHGTY
jgi:hypothetical protein